MHGSLAAWIGSRRGQGHGGERGPDRLGYLARITGFARWFMVCEHHPELRNWLVCESMSRVD